MMDGQVSAQALTDARPRVRLARALYCLLAWGMVVCVGLQTFWAGMAIFVDPRNWAQHTTFIHFVEAIPLLLLITAFLGRLPSSGRWIPVVMWILIGAQYAFAEAGKTLFSALHPVNALIIFWVAVVLAQRSKQWAFGPHMDSQIRS